MKSEEYWKGRFELLEEASNQKAGQYRKVLDREYRIALDRMEKEISVWYQRFADNNKVSMTEAKRMLTARELKELRWDVFEYIEHGEKNAVSGAWMKQLENASARVHISRLEALKIHLRQQVEVLYAGQEEGLKNLAKEIYTDTYYHTAYEMQKGISLGWIIPAIDTKRLDMALSRPWGLDNRTFSDRIWEDKEYLINTLQARLTQGFMRGDSPDGAISALTKLIGGDDKKGARYKAGRLVMTEQAFFASQGQKDCFNELAVERVEVVETLDSDTCKDCDQLDGKIVDMKDFAPGITVPPFHPWCRGCTAPYFDDNYGERAARGADGKTYYVPSDMKYPEWKEKYVDGKGLAAGKKSDKDSTTVIADVRKAGTAKQELDSFVKEYVDAAVEHARIISTDGKVYELTGAKGNVNIELAGLDALKNAVVIHNHPGEFADSFSLFDFVGFFQYQLKELRVVTPEWVNRMRYTGKTLNEKEAYDIYNKAFAQARIKAAQGLADPDTAQLNTMRILAEMLKGLVFDE